MVETDVKSILVKCTDIGLNIYIDLTTLVLAFICNVLFPKNPQFTFYIKYYSPTSPSLALISKQKSTSQQSEDIVSMQEIKI